MKQTAIRVRFAPSPTGLMHVGNIRTALLNYIFARKQNGTFIIRIEDTDAARNFDPGAQQILADLQWLGLSYDEGPGIGGPHAPYFQSERLAIYQEKLDELIATNYVYRCFCTAEELEKKRERAVALKIAPRYDRACLKLSQQELAKNLADNVPFIWRFKVDETKTISFTDLARGTMTFDLQHFSDFPVSRQDGSFTFLFANAIDDMVMEISHILRGEDHLSNTTNQICILQAFKTPIPTYWHLPIICSVGGKKLSKRDFGFSLGDLKAAGYLPEAIVNYLGTIGVSHADEIMTLDQLVASFDIDHIKSSGGIHYDVEKLRWVNNQWIARYSTEQLLPHVLPFLHEAFPDSKNIDTATMSTLVSLVKPELSTTPEIVTALRFYFEEPVVTPELFASHLDAQHLKNLVTIITDNLSALNNPEQFLANIKAAAKQAQVPLKEIFTFLRLSLTGSVHGQSMHDLLQLLDQDTVGSRITTGLDCLHQI